MFHNPVAFFIYLKRCSQILFILSLFFFKYYSYETWTKAQSNSINGGAKTCLIKIWIKSYLYRYKHLNSYCLMAAIRKRTKCFNDKLISIIIIISSKAFKSPNVRYSFSIYSQYVKNLHMKVAKMNLLHSAH